MTEPWRCPECKSKNTVFSKVREHSTGEADQAAMCVDCGKTWFTIERQRDAEAEMNKWHELGKVVAIEELAASLNARAGGLFTARRDNAAHEMRALADELAARAKKQREEYDKKYLGARGQRV